MDRFKKYVHATVKGAESSSKAAAKPGLIIASRAPRSVIPIALPVSALTILAAENRLDELGNQVCSLGLGTAGLAIGGAIGVVGGLIGVIIGRMLGEQGYEKFKRWLFTEDEDGVRPIDKIANTPSQATDI
ncbi:hypothetical protein L873DRAFT_1845412 [Choiromyces venosus 120613-1]|uniref:Uncharacterized protein n=1 Tax=Choiromyces venosus 120613-1 TaxID=1336337 RepID=A0A3N4JE14_9PEZI|nr:hypothetical protein L873DRAFT_1845412 [Choiromyces venosus 120613-1]